MVKVFKRRSVFFIFIILLDILIFVKPHNVVYSIDYINIPHSVPSTPATLYTTPTPMYYFDDPYTLKNWTCNDLYQFIKNTNIPVDQLNTYWKDVSLCDLNPTSDSTIVLSTTTNATDVLNWQLFLNTIENECYSSLPEYFNYLETSTFRILSNTSDYYCLAPFSFSELFIYSIGNVTIQLDPNVVYSNATIIFIDDCFSLPAYLAMVNFTCSPNYNNQYNTPVVESSGQNLINYMQMPNFEISNYKFYQNPNVESVTPTPTPTPIPTPSPSMGSGNTGNTEIFVDFCLVDRDYDSFDSLFGIKYFHNVQLAIDNCNTPINITRRIYLKENMLFYLGTGIASGLKIYPRYFNETMEIIGGENSIIACSNCRHEILAGGTDLFQLKLYNTTFVDLIGLDSTVVDASIAPIDVFMRTVQFNVLSTNCPESITIKNCEFFSFSSTIDKFDLNQITQLQYNNTSSFYNQLKNITTGEHGIHKTTEIPGNMRHPNHYKILQLYANNWMEITENIFYGAQSYAIELYKDQINFPISNQQNITFNFNSGYHLWGSFVEIRNPTHLQFNNNTCNWFCGGWLSQSFVNPLTEAISLTKFDFTSTTTTYFLEFKNNDFLDFQPIIFQNVYVPQQRILTGNPFINQFTQNVGYQSCMWFRGLGTSSFMTDFIFDLNRCGGLPYGLRFSEFKTPVSTSTDNLYQITLGKLIPDIQTIISIYQDTNNLKWLRLIQFVNSLLDDNTIQLNPEDLFNSNPPLLNGLDKDNVFSLPINDKFITGANSCQDYCIPIGFQISCHVSVSFSSENYLNYKNLTGAIKYCPYNNIIIDDVNLYEDVIIDIVSERNHMLPKIQNIFSQHSIGSTIYGNHIFYQSNTLGPTPIYLTFDNIKFKPNVTNSNPNNQLFQIKPTIVPSLTNISWNGLKFRSCEFDLGSDNTNSPTTNLYSFECDQCQLNTLIFERINFIKTNNDLKSGIALYINGNPDHRLSNVLLIENKMLHSLSPYQYSYFEFLTIENFHVLHMENNQMKWTEDPINIRKMVKIYSDDINLMYLIIKGNTIDQFSGTQFLSKPENITDLSIGFEINLNTYLTLEQIQNVTEQITLNIVQESSVNFGLVIQTIGMNSFVPCQNSTERETIQLLAQQNQELKGITMDIVFADINNPYYIFQSIIDNTPLAIECLICDNLCPSVDLSVIKIVYFAVLIGLQTSIFIFLVCCGGFDALSAPETWFFDRPVVERETDEERRKNGELEKLEENKIEMGEDIQDNDLNETNDEMDNENDEDLPEDYTI